jgi:hypothetical protein
MRYVSTSRAFNPRMSNEEFKRLVIMNQNSDDTERYIVRNSIEASVVMVVSMVSLLSLLTIQTQHILQRVKQSTQRS